MKRVIIILVLFSGLMISATQSEKIPQAQISNKLIKANLYLPDSQIGYYRATRFDWSGIIPSLEFKGHSYFGQWFPKYDPETHDAIMGPVEDFTPSGFDKAKAGDTFFKPGVGMLVKPDEKPYSSFKLYLIKNHGEWKIKKKADQVQFVHILNDIDYSYEYTKTVQLVKGKPELVLAHTLKNTGKSPIETDVYNHNFPMIDKGPSGPDITVTFAFNPGGTFRGPADIAYFQNQKLVLKRELKNGETIYCGGLTGFGDTSKDYDFKIENVKTGAGVRITSNQPLSKLVLWACPTTLCPEPYLHIKVDPGQEYSWKIFYEFYTFEIAK